MSKSFPRVSLILATLLVCAHGDLHGRQPHDDRRSHLNADGCLVGAGSALHKSILDAWSLVYSKNHVAECVDYQVVGQVAGLKLLELGRSDFAIHEASLQPQVQNTKRTLKSIRLGVVAVALIYNLEGVPSLRLSRNALKAIFLGEVTRWDDDLIRKDNPGVEMPPVPILLNHDLPPAHRPVVSKEAILLRYLNLSTDPGDTASFGSRRFAISVPYRGAEGATTFVKHNPGGLAYAFFVPGREGIRYAAIESDSGEFTQATASSISQASDKYMSEADARELQQVAGGYPMVTLVMLTYVDGSEKADHFVKWILVQSQQIPVKDRSLYPGVELVEDELEEM